MNSEHQYVPSGISIRGRTNHWFTYTVQKVDFLIDGFNEQGHSIFAGIQKESIPIPGSMIPGSMKPLHSIVDQEDPSQFRTIYLTHDEG